MFSDLTDFKVYPSPTSLPMGLGPPLMFSIKIFREVIYKRGVVPISANILLLLLLILSIHIIFRHLPLLRICDKWLMYFVANCNVSILDNLRSGGSIGIMVRRTSKAEFTLVKQNKKTETTKVRKSLSIYVLSPYLSVRSLSLALAPDLILFFGPSSLVGLTKYMINTFR